MGQDNGGNRFVVRKLADLIRQEGMQPGDKLPTIRQISEMWGLSRNVVRDAMLRAQNMGLVKIEPRLGIYVQTLDLSPLADAIEDGLEAAFIQEDANLLQIIESRAVIETHLAAEAAALRRPKDMLYLREALESMQMHTHERERWVEADERFHLRIASITDNGLLTTFLRILMTLLRPYRTKVDWTKEIRDATLQMHEAIYRCIVAGDVEGSRAAMQAHLDANVGAVLAAIATVPSEGPRMTGTDNLSETLPSI